MQARFDIDGPDFRTAGSSPIISDKRSYDTRYADRVHAHTQFWAHAIPHKCCGTRASMAQFFRQNHPRNFPINCYVRYGIRAGYSTHMTQFVSIHRPRFYPSFLSGLGIHAPSCCNKSRILYASYILAIKEDNNAPVCLRTYIFVLAPFPETSEGLSTIRTLGSLCPRFGRDPCSASSVASPSYFFGLGHF